MAKEEVELLRLIDEEVVRRHRRLKIADCRFGVGF